MKAKCVLTVIAIGLLTVSSLNAQETKSKDASQDQVIEKQSDSEQISQVSYACSMHCEGEKSYEKSGTCPKCGMNLTKNEMDHDNTSKTFTCSMHPEISSDKTGKCSKCGMDLIEKEEVKEMKDDHKGHNH